MNNRKYITAAIPYVNAKPHIGHALEFIQTNTLARYYRLLGHDVLTLSGGDENALKNVQAAEQAGVAIQKFVDENTERFRILSEQLNAPFDIWQKGSDTNRHFPSSQKLWMLCDQAGDIYKKPYTGLYCVGCEAFYSVEELDDTGECFEHPGRSLEQVEEENYFFRLSKYQERLEKLIRSRSFEIIPETRKNEVLTFIQSGLQDISISRTNERARNWGVPVPGDPTQRIYVWFDALNIYQSGIGFGWDDKTYKKWWPADTHVIGKGIIRFHAIYWTAFLLSAGLRLPKRLFVHEYFTVDGQKMSKTIGNVYDPTPLVKERGADPLRYYCLAKISPFLDGDFSEVKLFDAYNSDLANSLGNTVQRVATLCERSGFSFKQDDPPGFRSEVQAAMAVYRFDLALREIWKSISRVEKALERSQPWKLEGKKLLSTLTEMVAHLRQVGFELQPFLPESAERILEIFRGSTITAPKPLFPRSEQP